MYIILVRTCTTCRGFSIVISRSLHNNSIRNTFFWDDYVYVILLIFNTLYPHNETINKKSV